MKIGRLTSRVEVAGKDGKAGLEFSRLWDQVCTAVESIVGTTPTPFDPGTITLPDLAARVKAMEDRIAGGGL